MQTKVKKILLTGGGTGGHVIPLIAIVREIKKIHPEENIKLFYLGPRDDFGTVLLSQEGIKVKHIFCGKLRRYKGFKSYLNNFFDIFIKMPLGTIQSFFYLFFISPDLIFSRGGSSSIPVVVAGKIFFIPVFLHEADVVPSLTNRFLSRFALEIFSSFPKTEYFPLKKLLLAGNPIRKELLYGSKEEARSSFKISSYKPAVLILGGSQGAQRINNEILEVLPQILESFEVIHQCGEKNYEAVKRESKIIISEESGKSYHLFSFLREPELRQAYALSDVIVSRAGSGSIFEIAAAGKPSILIPLPEAAQNHQVKNAYAFARNGAAVVIEETNFTSRFFLEKLKDLSLNTAELQKMSNAAREFSKPEAAKIIANYLIEYLR